MEAVPESFICPISHEIMRDPYIDPDGNSYERQAIMDWLSRNPMSPITRRPMAQAGLIPNRSLRTLIQEFLDRNPSLRAEMKDDFSSGTTGDLKRKPLILYAIIDTSGSMGESCTEVSSGKEDDGFSRLDLVKHTLNTIITSLSAQDRICIIKFSNTAEMVANLTFLTETDKYSLIDRVQRLSPDASTNLWDGLRVAFDQMTTLSAADVESANIAAFLLTDGRPNIHPPRPILETVDNYIRKRVANGVKPIVHTFGYGYDIDSDMLYSISKQCNGFFGFIPDSSMVGTVFINSLSNCLVGKDPTLDSRVVDDASRKFVEVVSSFQRVAMGESAMIDGIDSFTSSIKDEIARQLALPETDMDVRGLSFLRGLLLDCEDNEDHNLGQVFKACSTSYYKKWGKHYLYSVMSSFENKVCINFKDKAMQRFKSEQFLVEQERIEDVFLG
jgi:Mg-chelatase subunit ChlD